MTTTGSWSVALVSRRCRRLRWLSVHGRLSSDPRQALRFMNPEVASQRVQDFMMMRGWDLTVMERFRLVPSPVVPKATATSGQRNRRSGSRDQDVIPGSQAA